MGGAWWKGVVVRGEGVAWGRGRGGMGRGREGGWVGPGIELVNFKIDF